MMRDRHLPLPPFSVRLRPMLLEQQDAQNYYGGIESNMKYYSEKLKKLFDKENELQKAEQDFDKKEAVELKKREERATRAKEVDEAYSHYLKLLKDFIKDYGSYHHTIKDNDFDVFFDSFWHWPF